MEFAARMMPDDHDKPETISCGGIEAGTDEVKNLPATRIAQTCRARHALAYAIISVKIACKNRLPMKSCRQQAKPFESVMHQCWN
jgi:hypothetical protein